MSIHPFKADAINASDFMKSRLAAAPDVNVAKAVPAVRAVKPKAAAAVTLAKAINPFSPTSGKFVFEFNQDMYGHYDRLGEGVMYKGRWVFEPAFFSPTAKAWDAALVSVELTGFDSSTVSYLKSYGATAKAWESRVLGSWANDPENFINECLYERLTDDQAAWLDASPHGAAVSAGTHAKAIKAMVKRAAAVRPHK